MKIGIKIGLKSDWKNDLIKTQPEFCEIWYDARYPEKYDEIFQYLLAHQIPSGLHFWGVTHDGILANLAYPDKVIFESSMKLALSCLETAKKRKCIYVNFHPTGTVTSKIDFDKELIEPVGIRYSYKETYPRLEESFSNLATIASENGTIITLESVPKLTMRHGWNGKNARLDTTDMGEMPITEIEEIFDVPNIYFAHDFGHTLGGLINPTRTLAIDFIFNIARRLQNKTKLLHVSYIVPPYNGTDYHGSLCYDEFSTTSAIPNRDEIKQLLKMYLTQDEIYALVEPEKDHIGNYRALEKLVREVS